MAAPGVWDEEFLVNAVTWSAQMTPVITALAGGHFAIAYTDYSRASFDGFSDFSGSAIRAQVFTSAGTTWSSAVQVNTVTSDSQHSPRIAALADGGFVVAYADSSHGWNSDGDDIWHDAVRLQMFNDDASRIGTETLVNTTIYGTQSYPCVALLENGQFVVGWNTGTPEVDIDLDAQLFHADGSFAGEEFSLNTVSSGLQLDCDIVGLPGGGFAAAWVDATGPDGDLGAIMARLFAADGTPLGPEILVNTAATGDQFQPSMTALAGGGFFVAWTDNSRGADTAGDDASHYAIRGQLFDAAGAAVGDEFRVNLVTTYGQSQPEVLALADGRFIVAYSDTSSGLETGGDDAEFGAIRARIFNPDGSPDGDEFLVNVTTTGHQNEPQMAQLDDGRVVFTWSDYSYGVDTGGDDPSNGAIRARILDLRETAADWVGTVGDDDFTGTLWNDTLVGAEGNDTLTGADGDDLLVGKVGDDCLDGGTGDDVLKGKAGDDTLRGGAGEDRLLGGVDADALFGGDGMDRLEGWNGNDHLSGERGDDTLIGGNGRDRLDGGDGDDSIRGGGKNDEIAGGSGTDLLTGGKGADIFVFCSADDSRAGAGTRDIITDYKDGVDRIDLSALDGNAATEHNEPLQFLGHGDFTGTPGEFRYTHGPKRSLIRIDLDGDATPDMEIELTDWHLLEVTDFIL